MADGSAVTRPAIRWMGGKWRLAPWIISHFPAHRTYVEPFGGGASVLLRKPRTRSEIYNDLDGEIVNLFRVLRDETTSAKLIRQLELTPFARDEMRVAALSIGDDVERARRLVVYAFQGFGCNGHSRVPTGFRVNSNRSGTTPARDWSHFPAALPAITERLRGVVIENKDAKAVMEQHDAPDALHYVDPPYVWDTRADGNPYDRAYRGYTHELTDDNHRELLGFLKGLRGIVVLSGYAHPIYDDALGGWFRTERLAYADGARPRTEVLWINRPCLDDSAGPLFAEAAHG